MATNYLDSLHFLSFLKISFGFFHDLGDIFLGNHGLTFLIAKIRNLPEPLFNLTLLRHPTDTLDLAVNDDRRGRKNAQLSDLLKIRDLDDNCRYLFGGNGCLDYLLRLFAGRTPWPTHLDFHHLPPCAAT
jgi:hypothetical protein